MSIAALITRAVTPMVRRIITQPAIKWQNLIPSSAAVRWLSGRSKCQIENKPRCDPGTDRCKGKKKKKKEKKRKRKSMWLNPECCLDPCPDIQPRYDDLYYRSSDKAKRKYMQTWVECPRVQIAKRKICCFKNVKPPPFKRRPRKKHRSVRDPCDSAIANDLMKCKSTASTPCPKISLPGCRGARDPPDCFVNREPKKCRKICTPYPSFSECQKPKPPRRRPIECRCLEIPSLCEVYRYLRKRGIKL